MADPSIEPYTTIIPMVRSTMGDYIYSDLTTDDYSFEDQTIADQINFSFLLFVSRDYQVPDTISISGGNLSPEILDDNKILRPLVFAASKRMLNILLQSVSDSGLDIERFGDKIQIRGLVKSLQEAFGKLSMEYDRQLINDASGFAHFFSIDEYGNLIPEKID